ncbi:MAG: hypothetical protein RML36_15580 [Anaerolineae bacterium]|nr:hypothetical protein [Anaerolineae bacterium]MDW8100893.1 hypothetical protein [Anaerolineae bacterium]
MTEENRGTGYRVMLFGLAKEKDQGATPAAISKVSHRRGMR